MELERQDGGAGASDTDDIDGLELQVIDKCIEGRQVGRLVVVSRCRFALT